MFEALAFGAFWFWVLVVAELVFLFSCSRSEKGWWATFSLLGFGAVLQWVSKIDILGFIWGHPLQALGCLGAYFVLGLGWGAFKWRNLYHLNTDEYEDMKADFMRDSGITPGSKIEDWKLEDRRRFVDKASRSYDSERNSFAHPLQIRDNKARWMFWASLWPMSFTVYVAGDMIVNTFNRIYRMCAGFLQDWANSHYAKSSAASDLKLPVDTSEEN